MEDDNTPQMPLRNRGEKVELVTLPDQRSPVLGYSYDNPEVSVRTATVLHWDSTSASPRQPAGESAPINLEMNRRLQTAYYYQLPEAVQAHINRAYTEPQNQPRKSPGSSSNERVNVKIRF